MLMADKRGNMFWAFILNPVAGTGFSEKVMIQLEERLQAESIPYRVFRTMEQGHGKRIAEELAADQEVIAVVSVGGDGTACEVAAAFGR